MRLLRLAVETKRWDLAAHTIVLAAGNVAEDRLYFQLKGRVEALYRIGDCIAPRLTDMAIVEGHRIGRMI